MDVFMDLLRATRVMSDDRRTDNAAVHNECKIRREAYRGK
jgi:hypothetical protein